MSNEKENSEHIIENNVVNVEEDVVENNVISAENDTADGEKPSGILAYYKEIHDKKLAKREKHKTALQFLKYALCAASAGIIQFLAFTILQAAIPSNGHTIHFIVEDMDVVTFSATTVALCLSILWNFTLNRKFTFKDAGNVPRAMVLAFLFYVPFYPFQTWCVHTVKSALSAHISADFAGIVGEATAMVCNFTLEFLWQKFVVFRKKKPKKTAVAEGKECVDGADCASSDVGDSCQDENNDVK